MRNGADYSLFVNTGQEFDGSDTGAKPDEAVSWGKVALANKNRGKYLFNIQIKMDAQPVKISGDSTFIFPLLVSQTFAKYKDEFIEFNKKREARNGTEWWTESP